MSLFRVHIRPLELKDAEISYKWRNDSLVWEYTESKPDKVITPEIEKQWLLKALSNKNEARFAIMLDDKYVGNIQLLKISETDAEYHIFIGDRDAWGKGVASLASYQILYYAKEELKLESVYLTVREDNISAIKLYHKLAFFQEKSDKNWLTYRCVLANLPLPTLSVFVMVYNHEAYLKECLDGILMQQCNFNFDVVVGEDASTDNSREILLAYQKNNPGKLKLLLHPHNIGAMANQIGVLNACFGKYIAMCEGDDYWTDPLKLQKQVDFLDKNLDFSICFHKVKMVYENVVKKPCFTNENQIEDTTIENLAYGNYIPTPSCVFRNILNPNFISIMKACPIGDYPLHLMNALNGKIKFLDENMATVRIISTGIWLNKSDAYKLKLVLDTLQVLIGNFESEINKLLCYNQLNVYLQLRDIISSEIYSDKIQIDYIPKGLDFVFEEQKKSINELNLKWIENQIEIKNIKTLNAYKIANLIINPLFYFKKIFKRR